MPRHLKKSFNKAHLENGTYEQIVLQLEMELELNSLEAPDEILINNVTQQAPQQNSEKRKPTCHRCKSQVTIKIMAVNTNEKKTKPELIWIVPTITMVVPERTLTPTIRFRTIPKRTIQIIRKTEGLDLSSYPVRHVAEQTTPQRNVILEQTKQIDHLPGIDDRKDKTKSNREMRKETQIGMSKLQPKL